MQNKPAQVAYMSHLSAGDSRSDSGYQPKVHLEVEWVGLVTSGFQFLLGLSAVFTEEAGGFGVIANDGPI